MTEKTCDSGEPVNECPGSSECKALRDLENRVKELERSLLRAERALEYVINTITTNPNA